MLENPAMFQKLVTKALYGHPEENLFRWIEYHIELTPEEYKTGVEAGALNTSIHKVGDTVTLMKAAVSIGGEDTKESYVFNRESAVSREIRDMMESSVGLNLFSMEGFPVQFKIQPVFVDDSLLKKGRTLALGKTIFDTRIRHALFRPVIYKCGAGGCPVGNHFGVCTRIETDVIKPGDKPSYEVNCFIRTIDPSGATYDVVIPLDQVTPLYTLVPSV